MHTYVQVAELEGGHGWRSLSALLISGEGGLPLVGTAARHSALARLAAAEKLVRNHAHVANDICNPSTKLNIHGFKALTQLQLERVPPENLPYVDCTSGLYP